MVGSAALIVISSTASLTLSADFSTAGFSLSSIACPPREDVIRPARRCPHAGPDPLVTGRRALVFDFDPVADAAWHLVVSLPLWKEGSIEASGFIALAGCAVAAPTAVRAQRTTKIYRIGYLG